MKTQYSYMTRAPKNHCVVSDVAGLALRGAPGDDARAAGVANVSDECEPYPPLVVSFTFTAKRIASRPFACIASSPF